MFAPKPPPERSAGAIEVIVTTCAKRSIYVIMEGSQIPVTTAPPTGTVTFLFTDIEGSTRLSQQYPDAMPGLLARHNQILRQAIEAHNGLVFQIIGDSFSAA